MIIDDFFIKMGVVADTAKLKEFATTLEKVENTSAAKSLDGVAGAAKRAGNEGEKAAQKTGNAFEGEKSKLTKFKGYITFVFGALSALSLGLVRSFANMFKEIDKLASSKNQLFSITQKELEQARAYTANYERTGQLMESLKARIGLGLLPVLSRLVDVFQSLIIRNKDFISEGLVQFFKVIVSIVEGVMRFVGAITNVINGTIGWKNALLILIAVLAIVKRATIAAFITNPITWVVLAIVALIAIIDDLVTYLNGGESAFAAFWKPAIAWCQKAWDKISPFVLWLVDNLFGAILLIQNAWGEFFDFISNMFDIWGDETTSLTDKIMATFGALGDYLKNVFMLVFQYILSCFGKNIGDVKNFISSVGQEFSRITDMIKKPFKDAFDWVKSTYDNSVGWIVDGIKGLGNMVGFGGSAAASAGATSNVSNNYRGGDVNANISVISPDPYSAGRNVQDSFSHVLARANNNLKGRVSY